MAEDAFILSDGNFGFSVFIFGRRKVTATFFLVFLFFFGFLFRFFSRAVASARRHGPRITAHYGPQIPTKKKTR